ncbi:MAG: pyridoxal-phosphate dependent enzyme [Bacteroidetes bacterium]|nr:pyridoxal-phosphate dependent enzyme [Bacteroidota bacterium]
MNSAQFPVPDGAAIKLAHQRIRPFINRTTVLTSQTINRMYNTEFFLKCENFQKVGAFKARGAINAVLSLEKQHLVNGVATHSSGNHAQALSYSASLVRTKAYIVMPSNSSKVKVEAVKGYGGIITFCEPTLESRETMLNKILKETGAIEIHPYNDVRIIAGQATAALELIEDFGNFDLILAPVGGGGLLSGTALSVHYFSSGGKVIAVEPEQANDAFLSFTQKQFVPSVNPVTIADGLRTSLGSVTFPIILDHVNNIVTVSEAGIVKAMRFLWERLKIIVEPSSAVPFAAIMEGKVNVSGKRTGIIISGGNVDLDELPWIMRHD